MPVPPAADLKVIAGARLDAWRPTAHLAVDVPTSLVDEAEPPDLATLFARTAWRGSAAASALPAAGHQRQDRDERDELRQGADEAPRDNRQSGLEDGEGRAETGARGSQVKKCPCAERAGRPTIPRHGTGDDTGDQQLLPPGGVIGFR